jgi:Nucleotidyltransferase/DNA polymerase involved in DNA repair
MISLTAYHFAEADMAALCEHLLVVSRSGAELGLNTADPTTLVIDLNCAFASIEQQHDPKLRGRPLAVAAYATDAATIVSSSREARDLGIKTGMRVYEGKAIFPRLVVMEPNPPRYRAVSDRLIEILEHHSPDVLRMSIDEASVNLAGTPDLVRLGPEGVGRAVKSALRDEIGECVTCSVGVSTSIWMAKQASNLNKRNGLERIDHTNLVSVFERLELTDLSGIAEATAARLRRAGIHKALDFLYANPDQLGLAGMRADFANTWHQRLRGFEVSSFEGVARKSYSHSHVLARATSSQPELEELLMRLSDMVGRRLRAAGRRGSVISIGVVYRPDVDRFSKQSKLAKPIATGDEIYKAALKLLAARDTRLHVGTLGVGLSGLSEADPGQMDLFSDPSPPRDARLENAMDAIRNRFGEDAVQRARLLGRASVVRDRIAFGNTGHPDEKRPT